MKVIIEFESFLPVTNQEVQYILMDALAEFQSNRGPTSALYVARRYKDNDWLNTEEKIKQVERRKTVAEQMRNNITVE